MHVLPAEYEFIPRHGTTVTETSQEAIFRYDSWEERINGYQELQSHGYAFISIYGDENTGFILKVRPPQTVQESAPPVVDNPVEPSSIPATQESSARYMSEIKPKKKLFNPFKRLSSSKSQFAETT